MIICVALGTLLSLMITSVQWVQQWQIENEVLLDSMTTRLTIANFAKQSDKPITVGRTGNYILYDGFRWLGIEELEARRVLSDGQKQALSSNTISPSWGLLMVEPVNGCKPFEQTSPDSPVHMKWLFKVVGAANKRNGNQFEMMTDITVFPNLSYFQFSPPRSRYIDKKIDN